MHINYCKQVAAYANLALVGHVSLRYSLDVLPDVYGPYDGKFDQDSVLALFEAVIYATKLCVATPVNTVICNYD